MADDAATQKADGALGEHYEQELTSFLRFARYKRNASMREVDGIFDDVRADKLDDATFTRDEVRSLLDETQVLVRETVSTELAHATHTSTLLLQQIFEQAQKWYLKLHVNTSHLEDQQALEAIAAFDAARQSSAGLLQTDGSRPATLPSLEASGSAALLQIEIDRLKEENAVLAADRAALQASMADAIAASTETQLQSANQMIQQLRTELEESKLMLARREGALEQLRADMSAVSHAAVEQAQAQGGVQAGAAVGDAVALEHTRSELMEAQAQVRIKTLEVEALQRELEAKVSATTPFRNLKKMLAKKNALIKELRSAQ